MGEQLVDTNEDLRNSESFCYSRFESTDWFGMGWDGRPVDEVNSSTYTALNPDARPIGTYETKTAVRTGKRSILAILRKNRGL